MRRGYFTPPVLIILAIIIFVVAILIAINTDLVKRIKNEGPPVSSPNLSPTSEIYISGLTIFLKENSTQREIDQLIKELKETVGVFDAKLVTPEEAIRLYREKYCQGKSNLTEYCDNLDESMLPPTIDISLDSKLAESIEKKFEKHSLIEKIGRNYSQF